MFVHVCIMRKGPAFCCSGRDRTYAENFLGGVFVGIWLASEPQNRYGTRATAFRNDRLKRRRGGALVGTAFPSRILLPAFRTGGGFAKEEAGRRWPSEAPSGTVRKHHAPDRSFGSILLPPYLKKASALMPGSSGGLPSRSTVTSRTSTSVGRRAPRSANCGEESDGASSATVPSNSLPG